MTVRLKDMAEELGVDKSTVSRALRGDPRVKAATAERIRALAASRGYRMNVPASALSEARWEGTGVRRSAVNFGYLTTAATEAELVRSADYKRLKRTAEARGYDLVPLALLPGVRVKTLHRKLNALGVRGVVLGPVNGVDALAAAGWDWEELEWSRCAWVSMREGEYAPVCHQVVFNSFVNTQTALACMVARGYRRIAVVLAAAHESRVNARQQAAWLSFAAQHPEVALLEVRDTEVQSRDPELAAWGAEALLLGYSGLRRSLGRKARALPWASLTAGPGEAGMVSDWDDFCQAVVDLLDAAYRRGAFGLPRRKHFLMVDSEWQDSPEHLPQRRPDG